MYNCCRRMNVERIIQTNQEIPLKTRTIIHFMLIDRKIHETIAHALSPFKVSLQQFNVLRILRGQRGKPANLSTINERMVTKKSNTTRLVDKLLLKGYVDRKICPSNRRKIEITITARGEAKLEEMDRAMQNAENEILHDLSDENLEQLNLLFDKF